MKKTVNPTNKKQEALRNYWKKIITLNHNSYQNEDFLLLKKFILAYSIILG